MVEDASHIASRISDAAWRALAHAHSHGLYPTRAGYAKGQTRQRLHLTHTVHSLQRRGLLAQVQGAFKPTALGVEVLAIIATKRAGPPLVRHAPSPFYRPAPAQRGRLPYAD